MSDYLPTVSKTYEFQGDTVSATFKRMTRRQMMAISPLLPATANGTPVEQSQQEQFALMDAAIEALAENVESFKGIKDMEGRGMDFEEVKDQAYFTSLLSEMAMDLITESMVQEKKNPSSTEPSTSA